YVIVIAMYLLFEIFAINYRPVLINGNLEASYPSSTTLLVLCVMPTMLMQCKERMKNQRIRKVVTVVTVLFMLFMVAGRLISGVHWFTDIIGGVLLSCSLVLLYHAVRELLVFLCPKEGEMIETSR
ncbi:MAG: phosphatase PAP2 family protein, partial [Lachnospiraceae bacterium]|nr:phosphatase PAP2 family protein [Lachnospiraceae bacterium]